MKTKNICGERVRLARVKLKMTQMDVSAALEVDHNIRIDGSTIGKIERFDRGVYDYELLALSEVLDVSVEWLLKGGKLHIS
ncbi:MAG: helix-turn-helix domain-containing protein [Deltaproteobacteria bacterium]|nr:helix-turn-helix domain-containing protein [Deltaproteobacteria bacterium]MBL7205912.1 helix-turn-helix domain-containing protein [Desulfobacteraceae bacterium]